MVAVYPKPKPVKAAGQLGFTPVPIDLFNVEHASHSFLRNGRPVREVGNPVFPNGTIRMELKGTKNALVEILLDPDSAKELTVWLNGKKEVVSADGNRLRLRVNGAEKICCIIGKHGRRYPLVRAVAVLKE